MRLSLAPGSGGVLPGGDDDVVAEGLELALGVAGLAAAVGVPGVPVGSEVPVAGGGVSALGRGLLVRPGSTALVQVALPG